MDMILLTDMILIMDTTITGVMILFIIIAGVRLLCSILTSGPDGADTILAGVDTTITIIMISIITDLVIMQITILTEIILIEIRITHREETLEAAPRLLFKVIMCREGDSSQRTIHGMQLVIAGRPSGQITDLIPVEVEEIFMPV